MPDDAKPPKLDLRPRIDPDDFVSVWYWALKLGVSREKLKEAIAHVGPIVDDVKKHLGK